jgi:hypothetical protein
MKDSTSSLSSVHNLFPTATRKIAFSDPIEKLITDHQVARTAEQNSLPLLRHKMADTHTVLIAVGLGVAITTALTFAVIVVFVARYHQELNREARAEEGQSPLRLWGTPGYGGRK